jgi:FSR family fosmidomycin resistance protein-like MFS transporter
MKYNRYNVLTMFGHICTDINQGALPAILPFLVLHKDISYTSAAGLIFAANSVSSFIQPLFGYLGDKVSWPWLMGLGVFLAGSGLAIVGFLDNYWTIFAAVTVSGIGIALFHPEGGRIANLAAGENKGAGIALFAVGGNIGFALGPIIASVALATLGLKGTAVLLVPAIGMAIVVLISLKSLKRITAESQRQKNNGKHAAGEDDWRSFFKVSACITSRSVVQYGLITFIPLYFTAVLMLPEASASTTLTLFLVAAAIATLLGGQAADRFGYTCIVRGGFSLLVPLVLIFPLLTNLYPAIFLLIPMAVALNAPQGATIAMGQKFLPNHIGTSSGIMLGLAVSMGGMVAPGIGWIGDRYGLTTAMYAVGAFAVLTMLLAFLIPSQSKSRTRHCAG